LSGKAIQLVVALSSLLYQKLSPGRRSELSNHMSARELSVKSAYDVTVYSLELLKLGCPESSALDTETGITQEVKLTELARAAYSIARTLYKNQEMDSPTLNAVADAVLPWYEPDMKTSSFERATAVLEEHKISGFPASPSNSQPAHQPEIASGSPPYDTSSVCARDVYDSSLSADSEDAGSAGEGEEKLDELPTSSEFSDLAKSILNDLVSEVSDYIALREDRKVSGNGQLWNLAQASLDRLRQGISMCDDWSQVEKPFQDTVAASTATDAYASALQLCKDGKLNNETVTAIRDVLKFWIQRPVKPAIYRHQAYCMVSGQRVHLTGNHYRYVHRCPDRDRCFDWFKQKGLGDMIEKAKSQGAELLQETHTCVEAPMSADV
jgi:hypothetical protein